ncbi:hypothetical protein [Streptomyces siamensis]
MPAPAGVPAQIAGPVAFETKVAMAMAMVHRAIAEKIPFGWVTAGWLVI